MNLSLDSTIKRQRLHEREKFAANLKKLRVAKGMTQRELATRSGVSRRALAGYEIGESEPSLKSLIRLADILNVQLDTLFGRKVTT